MNKSDVTRNHFMLKGPLAKKGYDWWWHSFTAENAETGEEQPFYLEFFVCNPAQGGDKPIFGQLPENQKKGVQPSYLMVKAGWWGENAGQIHRFFPWSEVKISEPLRVECGDCFLTEKEIRGSVSVSEEDAKNHPEYMCDSGTLEFDIKIDKKVAFHVGYGASKFFRKLNAFEMFWHAEGMKTHYSGKLILNGVEYIVKPETCYGYSDKNWGGDFTSPWVWLSSNNMTSKITGKKLENSVFDIGGGRPKVFGLALDRKLLSDFWYEGKSYEFNFSKLWTLTRTEFTGKETDSEIIWHVRQQTTSALMETEIRCFKKDMLFINYEAPNGKKLHNRLWNGGNGTGVIKLYKKSWGRLELIDEVEVKNVGCEYGEYDK
ncbi:MAG: hypothetical protein GX811_05980 [Lentisphaerae bacterium]|nr:hypothetical protein [Lentisphaerota bacterium]